MAPEGEGKAADTPIKCFVHFVPLLRKLSDSPVCVLEFRQSRPESHRLNGDKSILECDWMRDLAMSSSVFGPFEGRYL
jgi:hypothetical protein